MAKKNMKVTRHTRSSPKTPPAKSYPKPGPKPVTVKPHVRTRPSK